MTKPASVEQPVLIDIVLRFVQQFVPDFSAADIAWVRAMKASKFGVLYIQCRSVVMASRVRSTFASLVKTKPVPAFIGKVYIRHCNIQKYPAKFILIPGYSAFPANITFFTLIKL